PGFERDFVSRTLAFYNEELYLKGADGKLVKVDAPNSASKLPNTPAGAARPPASASPSTMQRVPRGGVDLVRNHRAAAGAGGCQTAESSCMPA
ncbi:hypothetical protein, partial [Xanthomonas arboricola]|uniref:hypothetical protein n=1 Tax=Xanthomonas arboricola TaxID=56448 RepID=UPI001C12B881